MGTTDNSRPNNILSERHLETAGNVDGVPKQQIEKEMKVLRLLRDTEYGQIIINKEDGKIVSLKRTQSFSV